MTRLEQIVTATAGRDRVLDAVKAVALLLVVVGHSLAWDVSGGTPGNVLEGRPGLVPLTWVFQVLPLFFAAGAVANLGSWRRRPDALRFQAHRLARLATPALVYVGFWTVLLLPFAPLSEQVVGVGRFLAQLTWFLGVYAAVVLAVPLTSRWVGRPVTTLALWFLAIVAVDVVRWRWAPTLGWLNLFLVWGWLHQWGYHLPGLRAASRRLTAAAGVLALAAALLLAWLGPYSWSLVSTASDVELSNLAPPTAVLALYGAGLVCLLASVWPWLSALLANERLWAAVAVFGSRAIGVYLWHIPVVGIVVGVVLLVGARPEPLGPAWWALHVVGAAVVLSTAWVVAGWAGRADRALLARGSTRPSWPRSAVAVAVGALPLVILTSAETGYATWWGAGLLGLVPSSSLLVLVLLALCWRALVAYRPGEASAPATAGAR